MSIWPLLELLCHVTCCKVSTHTVVIVDVVLVFVVIVFLLSCFVFVFVLWDLTLVVLVTLHDPLNILSQILLAQCNISNKRLFALSRVDEKDLL